MMKVSLVLATIAVCISGCTTIREHPVVSALVAGSVIATIAAHGDGGRGSTPPPPVLDVRIPSDPCKPNPASCQ